MFSQVTYRLMAFREQITKRTAFILKDNQYYLLVFQV